MSFFMVSRTMFTIGESRSISQTIERERQAQDNVTYNNTGNPRWRRFTIETLLQRERGLEIQREQRRRPARISSGRFTPRIALYRLTTLI